MTDSLSLVWMEMPFGRPAERLESSIDSCKVKLVVSIPQTPRYLASSREATPALKLACHHLLNRPLPLDLITMLLKPVVYPED